MLFSENVPFAPILRLPSSSDNYNNQWTIFMLKLYLRPVLYGGQLKLIHNSRTDIYLSKFPELLLNK